MTADPLVIVVGATGDLGGRIVQALVDRGTPARALVRGGTRRDRLPRGVEAVEVDFAQKCLFSKTLEGATCVISAVNGLDDVVIGLQSRLLDASVAAGVPRFISSDFSLDFTRTRPGRNRNLDLRRAFMARIDAAPIEATSILGGAFMDMLGAEMPIIQPRLRRVFYWGDVDQPLDFTTKDDVAAFTAAAASDPSTPRILRIAGDSLSARGLAAAMTQATGKRFKSLRVGGLRGLSTMIRVAKLFGAADAVFPAYQGMQYMRDMMSGDGKLQPLDNDRYPDLTWTSVAAMTSDRIRLAQSGTEQTR